MIWRQFYQERKEENMNITIETIREYSENPEQFNKHQIAKIRKYINQKIAEDIPVPAKIVTILNGWDSPPLCLECKKNARNWSRKLGGFGKFCSRECTDAAAKYGSNFEVNLRSQSTYINLKEYYAEHLEGKSLVKFFLVHSEFYSGLYQSTSFLEDGVSVSQRIWHILNDESPKCAECGDKVDWNETAREYRRFCSQACSNRNEETKKNMEKTLQENYGVSAPIQNEEIKDRISRTLSERYGNGKELGSFFESDKFKDEIDQIMIDKYGAENYFKSIEYKQKIISEEGMEWNGGDSELDSIFRKALSKKAIRLSTGKYYIEWAKNKDNDVQAVKIKAARNRQINSYGEHITGIINNRDWLLDEHYNKKKTLVQIAKELDISVYSIRHAFNKFDIPVKIYYSSFEEIQLGDFVESKGISIQRNVRDIINGELDIWIPEKNIAIEYCGLYWHSDIHKPNNYHYSKYKQCKDKGIRLITVFQNEWLHKRNVVETKLEHILGVGNKKTIYARMTKAHPITHQQAKKFHDNNHIQGHAVAKHHVGLWYDTEIVAVMSFNFDSSDWILTRYSTSQRVVGGVSKLLKYSIREFGLSGKIKTFADMRWDTGGVYEKIGFSYDGFVPPDYYYIQNDRLWHKFNFRKTHLVKFKDFDPNLSERENTRNMNIFRIYDCGKRRYVMELDHS